MRSFAFLDQPTTAQVMHLMVTLPIHMRIAMVWAIDGSIPGAGLEHLKMSMHLMVTLPIHMRITMVWAIDGSIPGAGLEHLKMSSAGPQRLKVAPEVPSRLGLRRAHHVDGVFVAGASAEECIESACHYALSEFLNSAFIVSPSHPYAWEHARVYHLRLQVARATWHPVFLP